MLCGRTLSAIAAALAPGGTLTIVTDNEWPGLYSSRERQTI